jgi:hypothetical protein
MTTKGIKSKFVACGVIGSIGICLAAALGADAPDIVRETFSQTAERWGIWAAAAISLTGTAVVGLVCLVRFVISTMRECIDDNTMSHLHLARVFTKRPCLHDSDVLPDLKEIESDTGPIGETGRRVLARRAKRLQRET